MHPKRLLTRALSAAIYPGLYPGRRLMISLVLEVHDQQRGNSGGGLESYNTPCNAVHAACLEDCRSGGCDDELQWKRGPKHIRDTIRDTTISIAAVPYTSERHTEREMGHGKVESWFSDAARAWTRWEKGLQRRSGPPAVVWSLDAVRSTVAPRDPLQDMAAEPRMRTGKRGGLACRCRTRRTADWRHGQRCSMRCAGVVLGVSSPTVFQVCCLPRCEFPTCLVQTCAKPPVTPHRRHRPSFVRLRPIYPPGPPARRHPDSRAAR